METRWMLARPFGLGAWRPVATVPCFLVVSFAEALFKLQLRVKELSALAKLTYCKGGPTRSEQC